MRELVVSREIRGTASARWLGGGRLHLCMRGDRLGGGSRLRIHGRLRLRLRGGRRRLCGSSRLRADGRLRGSRAGRHRLGLCLCLRYSLGGFGRATICSQGDIDTTADVAFVRVRVDVVFIFCGLASYKMAASLVRQLALRIDLEAFCRSSSHVTLQLSGRSWSVLVQ